MTAWRVVAGVGCLFWGASTVRAEPPTIDALIPSGAQRGTSAEVAVTGKPGTGPVFGWCDTPGVEIVVPEKPEGKITINVAGDVPPGLCYLRLFNAEGSSALKPFAIGTLPEATETEPNDSLDQAQSLDAAGIVLNGVLSKNGDVDSFAVELRAGQTLIASIDSRGAFGTPLDAVLQVLSPEGFVLEQNDDDRGMDPRIVFESPREGRYFVRAFGFPADPNSSINFAGGATWLYRLTLTTGPYVDHVQPLAVQSGITTPVEIIGWNLPAFAESLAVSPAAGDAWARLDEIRLTNLAPIPVVEQRVLNEPVREVLSELPVLVSGRIANPGEVDAVEIAGTKDRALSIRIDARAFDSPLDPVLRLASADGATLAEVDDGSRNQFDAEINYTPKADGPLRLEIRDRFDHGGSRYFYRVTIGPPVADYSLSLAAESFKLDPAKPLEIPVTINRLNGFAEEISVSAIGLPAHITAETVVSTAKGDSSKKVTLKLTTTGEAEYLGPFRVVGSSASNSGIERVAQADLAGIAHKTTQPWLTAPAKQP